MKTRLSTLSQTAQALKIILDLKYRANPKTALGAAIINVIDEKETHADEIIAFVKSQARDSFKTMADCIGIELTKRISNYSFPE